MFIITNFRNDRLWFYTGYKPYRTKPCWSHSDKAAEPFWTVEDAEETAAKIQKNFPLRLTIKEI